MGKTMFSRKLVNGQAEIEALVARAQQAAEQVRWAVDMTSGGAGLLLAVLATVGQQVIYVPGRLVNRMAGAYAGEGKTDAKVAHTIAETARLRHDLTTVAATDQIIAQVRVLTSRREDLMGDWVRSLNRLRDLLASIFPALERALDYSNRSPLILLTGYCTPGAIRAIDGAALASWLRERGASARTVADIVAKAEAAADQQSIARCPPRRRPRR